MRTSLLSPFRVPFRLSKEHLLANLSSWQQCVARLMADATDDGYVQRDGYRYRFGNYGWGRPPRGSDTGGEAPEGQGVFYGEEGAFDPGWFFKDHFFLLLRGEAPLPTQAPPLLVADRPIEPLRAEWKCRLIDHNLAMLSLEWECGVDQVAGCERDDREAFARWNDGWVDALLAETVRPAVEEALQTLQQAAGELSTGNGEGMVLDLCRRTASTQEVEQSFFDSLFSLDEHPIYHGTYRRLWTHHGFAFAPAELAPDLSRSDFDEQTVEQGLAAFLLPHHYQAWKEADGRLYGWGVTIRELDPDLDEQWLEAASLSEYYYTLFDIADTALPILIARQRSAAEQGRHGRVMAAARDVQARLRVIEYDYGDLRTRAASEAHKVVEDYHRNWRMDDQLRSLNTKLDFLAELIATSSDTIDKRTQKWMNYILFAIGLLGLISLFTGLHDYLSGGITARFYDGLPKYALILGKSHVMLVSLTVIVLVGVAFYLLDRRGR